MRFHELKTVSPFYEAVESGDKTFEIRTNDRDFRAGDILLLRHWDENQRLFGQGLLVKTVTYVLYDERFLPPGYCCMSIE